MWTGCAVCFGVELAQAVSVMKNNSRPIATVQAGEKSKGSHPKIDKIVVDRSENVLKVTS